MILTASDIDIAARTLWGEARGESYKGKMAVAHVLLNRWKTTTGQFRKDDTLATACLRHVQFSTWNHNDPNFARMQTVNPSERTFRECMRAVLEAVDSDDPTFGSRHYHTKNVSPVWSVGKEPAAEIGRHKFYADID